MLVRQHRPQYCATFVHLDYVPDLSRHSLCLGMVNKSIVEQFGQNNLVVYSD